MRQRPAPGSSVSSVLGISAFYHDAAAAVVRDGEIVAAAQEERFSRRKHDPSFPRDAAEYCLREADLRVDDLSAVAFYEKPWIKFERILMTSLAAAPRGVRPFLRAMPLWLKQKLWTHRVIREELGWEGEIVFPEHHESHAASAFAPSPFRRSAFLTLDGVGEWATGSWGRARRKAPGSGVEIRRELRFPHSLGLLYSAFTAYLGFRVNSGEYKMMGLAPYGDPVYRDRILKEVVDLRLDGSLRLELDFFRYHRGLRMTSRRFHELFGGPPREPGGEITPRHMDLARSIQAVTEEAVLRMARHVREETGEENLCMAGGVALNSVANGELARSDLYDRVWIQPAAGDAGGAVGAAFVGWRRLAGGEEPPHLRRDRGGDGQRASLLGPAFAPDRIAGWLEREGIPHDRRGGEGAVQVAADHLAAGRVVGWFSGRMEYGPRALGSRSILADPRDPEMQSVLNRKIKGRESFRPFAPSCLVEDAAEWFEAEEACPYMLRVVPVREERLRPPTPEEEGAEGLERLRVTLSEIPAVTHVDGTSRIQTVDRRDHPRFHALLRAFRERTGCGMVVNTSFNRSGEPIVCTPEDAYRCFMGTGMDVLVLEDCVLRKGEQPESPEETAVEGPDRGTGPGEAAWG